MSWALFRLCGPSLAVVNCCGPLWACVGLCWPSLAAVGLPGLSSNRKIKNKMYIKKKTPPMRRSGPFSSLWAFVGRRWLLWAFLGLRWPSLAIVNCCGPSWACVGRRWLLWAFLGLRWPLLAVVNCCGPLWACVGLRWPLWAFLGLPGLSSNKKIKNEMYIKKKAYLWPKRRDWRRLGPFSLCGPSLAVVGCCGPWWALVGLRWPSLASVGLPGPALAFVGRCWLLWAFLGLVVIKKFKMQGTLRKTPTYGPNDASRVVWALFHLRGPSLAVVGCCGPSWACVGLLWLLCDSLSRFTMLIAVVG